MIPWLAFGLLLTQAVPDWEVLHRVGDRPLGEVRAVEALPDGSVLLGLRGSGLLWVSGGEGDLVTVGDGLAGDGIADFHRDEEGRIWAVGLGGYSVRDGRGWVARSELGGITPRVVFGIHEAPGAETIWLATSSGAVRLRDGQWTLMNRANGLPHDVVHAVWVDEGGVTWLACRTGLGRLERDEITVLFEGTNFRSIVEGSDGTLWFGTSDGVRALRGSTWTTYLDGSAVLPALVAADGSVWAKSDEEGVHRYVDGAWHAIPVPAALEGAAFYDISEAPDGAIWFATSVGAARLRPER